MGLKMEKKTIKKQIAFLTEELQITLPTTDRMMEKCSEILWKNLCPELEQLSVRLLIRDIHQLKREGKLRGRTARDQYLFYEDKYLLEKDHIRKLRTSCANYGHDAYFVTKLPKHEIGQSAVNALRKYGVKTDFIARGGDRVGPRIVPSA